MGKLKKFHERPGVSGLRKTSVIIVPGLSANSLAEQTCSHFEEWIEKCCGTRDTPMTVWIYHHGVELNSRQCWDYFCSAGSEFLTQLLDLHQSNLQLEDTALVLIGHRLGAFVLKKALIEAHRRNHHIMEKALFEALHMLIMIGDPDLHDENRHEWTQLIQQSLSSSKKLSPEICSEEALVCLKSISDTFEDVTLYSRFFQVSGRPPAKQRILRLTKSQAKFKGCVCYANISVRMWSTADDDEDVLPDGEGDEKKCVFHAESGHRKSFLMMASNHIEMQQTLKNETADAMEPMRALSDGDLVSLPKSRPTVQATTNGNSSCMGDSTRGDATGAQPTTFASADVDTQNTRILDTEGDNTAPIVPAFLATKIKSSHDPQVIKIVATQHSIRDSAASTDGVLVPCGNDNYNASISNRSNASLELSNFDVQIEREVLAEEIGLHDADITEPQANVSHPESYDNGTSNGSRSQGIGTKRCNIVRTHDTIDKIPGVSLDNVLSVPEVSPSTDELHQTEYPFSVVEDCMTTPPRRSRKLPLKIKMPLRSNRFVGREEIMQKLRTCILSDRTTSKQSKIPLQKQKLVLIQGAAGIGKTAVALEFAYRHQEHFDHIFWIRAYNQVSIAQSIHEAAIALGLIQGRSNHNHAESRAAFRSYLEATKSQWLMIFDDADNLGVIDPYMPFCNSGSIILTTRMEDALSLQQQNRKIFSIRVTPLNEKECFEFLSKAPSTSRDLWCTEDATEVGTLLGGHPLALTLVAAYVGCGTGSFPDRRKIVRDLRSRFRSISASPQPTHDIRLRHDDGSLLSTMLSLNSVSPEAKDLCRLVSYMDPHDVQNSILLGGQTYNTVPLEYFPLTDDRFVSAKNEALSIGFCTVTVSGDFGRFGMHRLVQAGIRASLKSSERVEAFDTASLLCLTQWPSERKFRNILQGNWPEFDQLHSHVYHLSELFTDLSTENMLQGRKLADDYSAFTKLLLQSTWYNSCIRGNADEDVSLIQLCHRLLASSNSELSASESGVVRREIAMPRRLVRLDESTRSWKLIDTEGQGFPYVALSYVLGNQLDPTGTTQLTRATLKIRRNTSAILEMPRLFRDAAYITRRLGIRHLWVDAICIIQDDDGEKRNELSVMDEIYRNAVCTIVPCNHSPQEDPGFFPSYERNRQINIESYSILDHEAPWDKRAWMVQESILSSTNVNRLELFLPFYVFSVKHRKERSRRMVKSTVFTKTTPQEVTSSIKNLAEKSQDEKGRKGEESHLSERETKPPILVTSSTITPERVSEFQAGVEDFGSRNNLSAGVEVHHSEPQKSSYQIQKRFEFAKGIAQEVIQNYDANRPLVAIAKLVKARSCLCTFMKPSIEGLHGHLLFSTYLALVYLDQESLDTALEILTDDEELLKEHTLIASQLPLVIMGHFYMVIGDTYLALKDFSQAQNSYEQAIAHLIDGDEQSLDLYAIAQLKISDIQVSRGSFEEAHTLLQSTVSHFEVQDSVRGQAQYARALHRQAELFGAQGKERIRKVKYAAASQALRDFCEETGTAGELPEGILTKADFEKALEFQFR